VDRLIVLVLTCDRLNYTKRTVDSFLELNYSQMHGAGLQFDLFYADDASIGWDDMKAYMQSRGFICIHRNETRAGCSPCTRDALLKCLHIGRKREASWGYKYGLLYLQNDWESAASLPPLASLRTIFSDKAVGWMRLYGAFKDKEQKQPVSGKHLGNGKLANWMPYSRYKGMEVAQIHWCYNPSITRLGLIKPLFSEPVSRESDVIHRSAKLSSYVAVRYPDNVMYHIGDVVTPGGMFGRQK